MMPLLQRCKLQRICQPQRERTAIAFPECQIPFQGCTLLHARMPHRDPVVARRHLGRPGTGCIGAPEIRCVGHHYVRQHGVMNVATQGHQSYLIELDWRIGRTAVQGQLKALGGGKRIDLVADGITVGKCDGRINRQNQQIRNEGSVHLVHDGVHRGTRMVASSQHMQGDDGAGQRSSLTRLHGDHQVGAKRVDGSKAQQQQQQRRRWKSAPKHAKVLCGTSHSGTGVLALGWSRA